MPDKIKLFREKSLYKEWRKKLKIEENINPIIYILYMNVYKDVVDFIFYTLKGRVLEVQLQEYLMKHKGLTKGQAKSYISSMIYHQFVEVVKSSHYNFLQLKDTVLKILGKRIPNRNINLLKLSAIRCELINEYVTTSKLKQGLNAELKKSEKDDYEVFKTVQEQEENNVFIRRVVSKDKSFIITYDLLMPEVTSIERAIEIMNKAIFKDGYEYKFTIHFYGQDDLKRFQKKVEKEEISMYFVKDIKLNNLGTDRYFLNLSQKQKQFNQKFKEFSVIKDLKDYVKKESENNV